MKWSIGHCQNIPIFWYVIYSHELQNADMCAVHVISIELISITTVTTGGGDKNNTFNESQCSEGHI